MWALTKEAKGREKAVDGWGRFGPFVDLRVIRPDARAPKSLSISPRIDPDGCMPLT